MPAWAQQTTTDEAITNYESATHQFFQGTPTDWSSSHVVFSKPEAGSDTEDAVQKDPRYWLQQIRESMPASENPDLTDGAVDLSAKKNKKKKKKKSTLTGLWSVNLGSDATVGPEMFPATFTSGASPSCINDFAVYNTSLPGTAGKTTIAGFNNIYSGTCTGTVPTVEWAFNTGGQAVTSPVISPNGQKIAFVQSGTGGAASLIILTWKAGTETLTAPMTLTSNASYPVCTAPCMISIPFNGGGEDTNSSPFYASGDTLYVGDNSGQLHKFTGVFSGTPAEVTTNWPITVHASTILSSPVADANTGNIFVGDASGLTSYVRDVGSTTGTCNSGTVPCLGTLVASLGGTIVDGPLLDVTVGKVFWFDATSTGTLADKIEQTDEALANARLVTLTASGGTDRGNMHAGAFDNTYYNTPTSGFLYVCAVSNAHPNHPSLYRIGFTNAPTTAAMNTTTSSGPLDMVAASESRNECSPITEIQTSTTDDFFVSVEEEGDLAHCTGSTSKGCLYSFAISSQTFPTNSTAGLAATGGTSGISIDNIFSAAGASQVYFTPLGNQFCTTGGFGGCATQASQAGLN